MRTFDDLEDFDEDLEKRLMLAENSGVRAGSSLRGMQRMNRVDTSTMDSSCYIALHVPHL